jgi:hypothetical protein
MFRFVQLASLQRLQPPTVAKQETRQNSCHFFAKQLQAVHQIFFLLRIDNRVSMTTTRAGFMAMLTLCNLPNQNTYNLPVNLSTTT